MDRFKQLKKQDNNFINVILDDWRGFRLIFDTSEVRQCKNNCKQCPLYKLLQKNNMLDELCPANREDKKIFGPQNFLNCKTIRQYINCYVNFLNKKCQTKKQLEEELKLVKNSKVIYSKEKISSKMFKKSIMKKVLKLVNRNKKEIINNYLFFDQNFFD